MTEKPKWEKDLMDAFLNATRYSGTREPGDKVISASSLGKEPYYLLLEFKHGKKDEQAEYGANTTGSIYQLGIDSILKDNPRYWVAKRLKHDLGNGWVCSGELDIYDTEEKIIIDDKVLAGMSYEKTLLDDIDSDYNLQQASYKMLLLYEEGIDGVRTALHCVNKAGSATKNNIYKNFEVTVHEPEVIKQMMIDKTNELQHYIDTDTLPPICDIFKFGKTNGVANRCKLYCDYNHVCPNYNAHSHHTTNLTLNSLEPTAHLPKKETYLPGKDYEF